jgi:hypothetical protein
MSSGKYVKPMAHIVKLYRRVVAKFPALDMAGLRQIIGRTMLAFFKSQASRDFDKAMDYLECSRTLMGSAIETHRAIVENQRRDYAGLCELAAIVKPADEFLNRHLETTREKFEAWKLYMQLRQPERYRKIEHIVNHAEKNLRVARQKAIHINYWVRFDRPLLSRFS